MEYAQLARSYGIHKIVGDAYAGEWVANAFADAGILYETSPLNKSQLWRPLPTSTEALSHSPTMTGYCVSYATWSAGCTAQAETASIILGMAVTT